MSDDLKRVIRQVASSVEDNVVSIELICADNYGARVLFDDVVERLQSESGFRLWIKAGSMVATEDER